MTRTVRQSLIFIIVLTIVATFIALPRQFTIDLGWQQWRWKQVVNLPPLNLYLFGKQIYSDFPLKKGLDIQGGMQLVLQADMSKLAPEDRLEALESAREVISRRVDLFGVSEPVVQTSRTNDDYRLIVELPGVTDSSQALQLLGKTAELEFKIQSSASAEATQSAVAFLNQFTSTGLTGKQLKKAVAQFDTQTGEPAVGLQFKDEGREILAKLTSENTGKIMPIFIDGFPVTMPQIKSPILDGQAAISGGFKLEEVKQLVIQLNSGALPAPISVLEQRTIGASLGEVSVAQSVRAGLVGLGLVALFMILMYGFRGVISTVALVIYAILTIAIYKLVGVTLTLPGIAGLLLSIGMAVDANILIFERMKEELRMGEPLERAMELGFGRAWDSIKDANLTTILASAVLINPLDFSFLNTSGLVRGFGVTLFIGVMVSLFTGVVVSRTLLRAFLPMVMRSNQSGASQVKGGRS